MPPFAALGGITTLFSTTANSFPFWTDARAVAHELEEAAMTEGLAIGHSSLKGWAPHIVKVDAGRSWHLFLYTLSQMRSNICDALQASIALLQAASILHILAIVMPRL